MIAKSKFQSARWDRNALPLTNQLQGNFAALYSAAPVELLVMGPVSLRPARANDKLAVASSSP